VVFDIVEQFQQNMYLWMMLEDRSSQQTAKKKKKKKENIRLFAPQGNTFVYYSKYAKAFPYRV